MSFSDHGRLWKLRLPPSPYLHRQKHTRISSAARQSAGISKSEVWTSGLQEPNWWYPWSTGRILTNAYQSYRRSTRVFYSFNFAGLRYSLIPTLQQDTNFLDTLYSASPTFQIKYLRLLQNTSKILHRERSNNVGLGANLVEA